jgi:DNA polymerase-3 subunit delta
MNMDKETKTGLIYVITGQDVHLRSQAIQKLRHQLLGEDEGLGEVRMEGKTADLKIVLDELRTLAFLADKKVVIIEEADKFISDHREALETYFENPNPNGVMVLVCDSWRKNTRLAKLVDKIGTVIAAEVMKERDAAGWVMRQAKELGKELTPACANDLVAVVGTETGRLANELEKLAMYVGERKYINGPDIEALCGPTAMESVFRMTDLMAEGKAKEAMETLHRVLESDKSAEYTLVGAISFSLKRLLKARAMLESGLSQAEVSSACKIYPGIAQRFFGQVRRFTTARLQNLLHELAEIDYANKTGLGQATLNLEKFILCTSSTV